MTFYIGRNARENFEIIDAAGPEDLWFHADDSSSCHVVALCGGLSLDKKQMRTVCKAGAQICKENTKKLAGLREVSILYTTIKNVTKTEVLGSVIAHNTKVLIC